MGLLKSFIHFSQHHINTLFWHLNIARLNHILTNLKSQHVFEDKWKLQCMWDFLNGRIFGLFDKKQHMHPMRNLAFSALRGHCFQRRPLFTMPVTADHDPCCQQQMFWQWLSFSAWSVLSSALQRHSKHSKQLVSLEYFSNEFHQFPKLLSFWLVPADGDEMLWIYKPLQLRVVWS